MINNAQPNKLSLRTALLSTGHDPLAFSTFNFLQRHSELHVVIFSEKKSKVSKWKRSKEYGFWYVFQYIVSKIFSKFRKRNIYKEKLLKEGINYSIWREASDATETIELLQANQVDIVIVCGFQHILKRSFYSQFKHVINIHPSYLPAYRGPEPIIWGLIEHQKNFGVTLHYVDDGIDTGDIIAQCKIKRPFLPIAALVEQKLANVLPCLLEKVIKDILDNQLHTYAQPPGFYLSAPTLHARQLRKTSPK
jgi:methionyl-tRNA formyltransferase